MVEHIMGQNALVEQPHKDTINPLSDQAISPQISPYREGKAAAKKELKPEAKPIPIGCAPSGLFEIQRANDAIKEALAMPDPVYLYPGLIQEREFIILFADTGIGKTVFAFQTAIHIANEGHRVIFLDLELSKKQFQKRYTDENGVPYTMPETLYRVGYSRVRSTSPVSDYTAFFIENLKELLKETGAKVLYIDNLTKLSAGSTDTAKDTIPILNALNALQAEYQLTIIAIEHNKKVDTSRPIALNDLQGSKMKANLCDTILSIGRCSYDSRMRYVKQVKVRDGEHVYDTDNVIICEIGKSGGYLKFTDTGHGNELDLLRDPSSAQKEERLSEIIEMNKNGMSNREIAKQMNVSEGAIRKWLKTANNAGNSSTHPCTQ